MICVHPPPGPGPTGGGKIKKGMENKGRSPTRLRSLFSIPNFIFCRFSLLPLRYRL